MNFDEKTANQILQASDIETYTEFQEYLEKIFIKKIAEKFKTSEDHIVNIYTYCEYYFAGYAEIRFQKEGTTSDSEEIETQIENYRSVKINSENPDIHLPEITIAGEQDIKISQFTDRIKLILEGINEAYENKKIGNDPKKLSHELNTYARLLKEITGTDEAVSEIKGYIEKFIRNKEIVECPEETQEQKPEKLPEARVVRLPPNKRR